VNLTILHFTENPDSVRENFAEWSLFISDFEP